MSVHGNLRMKPKEDYRYAKEASAVLLASMELHEAAREYPFVFVKQVRP